MRKLLLLVMMCVCVPIGALAATKTEMYDYGSPRVLVGTVTMDGDKATIEFTGNGNTTNFDKSALNGNFTSIKDVKVKGPIPSDFEQQLFSNSGHYFSACERVDFSEASGGIHTNFHNNVKGIVLPSDKSFSYVSSGGNYIVIANRGDSEANAVKVWAKNDSNNDWASDPVVLDADYIKAYTDSDGSTYVEGDVITNLRSSKWVNGDGTVFATENFTYPSSEFEGMSLSQALETHLATKKIGKCTISGELSDLTVLYGVKVQTVDLSGVTNTDLGGLALPNVTNKTENILLPQGVTYNSGRVTSTSGQGNADQLKAELLALKNADREISSVIFPDGSTFANGVLTAQTNTTEFLEAAIGGGLDVSKVVFPDGAVWENGELTFTSTSEADMKDIVGALQSAGFVLNSVELSSGTTWTGGTVTLRGSDDIATMKGKFGAAGLETEGVIFTNGTKFENGKLTTVSADEEGPNGSLRARAEEIRSAFGEYAITSLQMSDHTAWDNGTVTAQSGVDHNELLNDAGFTVSSTETYDYCGTYVTEKNGVVTLTIPAGQTFDNISLSSEDQDKLKSATSLKIVGETGDFTTAGLKDKLGQSVSTLDLSEAVIPETMTLNGSIEQISSTLTALTLPSGGYFTKIPDGFCTNITSLSSVNIPSQVTTIGKGAFQGCTSLSNIDWGDDCHVELLEESAFQRANISGNFVMPNSVRYIMNNAFDQNNNMKTLTFGEYSQIESIGASAFAQKESTDGKLSDVFIKVQPAREIECAHGAFDKFHAAAQTQVGTVTTRLHYPREYYEYYVGTYKSELYDQNLDYVEDGVTKHTYGVITQDIINRSFAAAANGWQEFMSSGIPVGSGALYRTYSEEVSHLVPDENKLKIYLVHDYDKDLNVATCVQMKEGDLIPANTGFIIHSNVVATIYLPFAKAQANPYNHEDHPANTYKRGGVGEGYNNYLKPINGKMKIENVEVVNGKKTYRNYFFNNGTTAASRPGPDWKEEYAVLGWGFFRAKSKEYTVWNKAFLHLPAEMTNASSTILDDSGNLPQDQQGDSGAKSFGMYIIGLDESSETTPVERVFVTNESGDGYYTLQGVRVNTPANKGIYIHNGKKVVVK